MGQAGWGPRAALCVFQGHPRPAPTPGAAPPAVGGELLLLVRRERGRCGTAVTFVTIIVIFIVPVRPVIYLYHYHAHRFHMSPLSSAVVVLMFC